MSSKQALYNTVASLRTISDRFADGTMSTLMEAGDGWLQKSDDEGVELCAREFEVLLELQGTGVCPDVDEEEGIFGYPDSFLIRRVNNGATLGEYMRHFLSGEMEEEHMREIFSAVAEKINLFHSLGWVHGDLHDRNVVVGTDKRCQRFIPFVIDFGFSFREDEGPHEYDRTSIETMEEDNAYLGECLFSIIEETTSVVISDKASALVGEFLSLLD